MLNKVSRSFAMVIQQLPPETRDAVCVFYLVLRTLDTIEDDMSLDTRTKVPQLQNFHEQCSDPSFKRSDVGSGDSKSLMEQYHYVADAFNQLAQGFQRVIREICQRMGSGMAEFIEKRGVETYAELDRYCHFVAGLVGIGLSQLFAESGQESSEFKQMEQLSNHMGLFLQKTNIIRDYKEDMEEGELPRVWWPKEAWSKYADALEHFLQESKRDNAKACLNELIANALEHAPRCLEYMSKLNDQSIFRFCAIPQTMAIATLERCFDNGAVFEQPVKVDKGEVARINLQTCSIADVRFYFAGYAASIVEKSKRSRTRNADSVRRAALTIVDACGVDVNTAVMARKNLRTRPHSNAIFGPLSFAYLAYAFNVRFVQMFASNFLPLESISSVSSLFPLNGSVASNGYY